MAFSIFDDPPRVSWENKPVEMNADEALSLENDGASGETALDRAVGWLRCRLEGGPLPANELKDQAELDGIAPRTLDRAKAVLGVIVKPSGFGGPRIWWLPGDDRVRQATKRTPTTKQWRRLAILAHSVGRLS
ncbi:MAG TPA: hypothetical protein VFB80_19205 [Pirellulaceae bacterium]|nr:hypothetical protein [Pirellulaceae bacterium]